MLTSVQEHRLRAAGGDRPAPTMAWSQFRFLLSMNERAVLMPWYRLFCGQQDPLLVAAMM